MKLNDVLRRSLSDRELALQSGVPPDLDAEESKRLANWFGSAHRRNELEIVAELDHERLLALALWCHIDAQTLSDMPPEIRRQDLELASGRFQVDIRALPSLITSTTSLFGRVVA